MIATPIYGTPEKGKTFAVFTSFMATTAQLCAVTASSHQLDVQDYSALTIQTSNLNAAGTSSIGISSSVDGYNWTVDGSIVLQGITSSINRITNKATFLRIGLLPENLGTGSAYVLASK